MRRCDDLARAICYSRKVCEGRKGHVCKGPLQWAHIIGRGDHWVRHDEDNALLLCASQHLFFTKHPTEWIGFIGEERYFALHRRAFDGLRLKIDWRQREADLIARAKELGIML